MDHRDLPRKLERPYISLTTDFGLNDESVGAMKAVIRNICPDAIIEDNTHGVKSFDMKDGAWCFWATLGYAPIGIHMAVVDPGVGTERRPLAIELQRYDSKGNPFGGIDYLIGPDNGLLIPAIKRGKFKQIVEIDLEKVAITPISPIFHGRDIFASAAAHLASGKYLKDICKKGRDNDFLEIGDLQPAPYGEGRKEGDKLVGEVLRVDDYGNVFATIPFHWAEDLVGYGNAAEVSIGGNNYSIPLGKTFASVGLGKLVMTDDGYEGLQFAANKGNASKDLRVDMEEAAEKGKSLEVIITRTIE